MPAKKTDGFGVKLQKFSSKGGSLRGLLARIGWVPQATLLTARSEDGAPLALLVGCCTTLVASFHRSAVFISKGPLVFSM